MKRSIEMFGSNKVPYKAEIPLKNQCVVNSLPSEVVEFIFSLLDDISMQAVNLVSKDWSQRAINTGQQEHNRVTCFIRILSNNLLKESHESEMKKLFAIAEAKGVNLIHIHAEKSRVKENVLDVIKFLKKEDLDGLEKRSENAPKPQFFEDLFVLAPIYCELDKTGKINDGLIRESRYRAISNRLADCGQYDKSLEVAHLIKMESIRMQTFKYIYLMFAKNGLVSNALEIVNLLKYNIDKSVAYKLISNLLVERGDLEAAEKVAFEILYKAIKIEAYKIVYKAHLKLGSFDEAAKIHNLIYPDVVKSL